jgi:hypothetical protein
MASITSYSDYYKKKSKTPGASVDDSEQPDDTTTNHTTRPFKTKMPEKPTSRVMAETEAEKVKKEAIKRRLKLAAGKTSTSVIRRR